MSGGTLGRRDDLGMLLDLGRAPARRQTLEELCFQSKFLHRAYGIMNRIGPNGEGYDRLASEFARSLDHAVALITGMLKDAPADARERFERTYLVMTHGGVESLLALCHDLAWYKNWLIDAGRTRAEST
ncbi:MAG: hypothetical protein AB1428_02075 [Bacteroidota bacterium]